MSSQDHKHGSLQLRVVFDTNKLHIDSASRLAPGEIGTLLMDSNYTDLEIVWYLADVVRHERQYQMQRKARDLYSPVKHLEGLLGKELNITEELLLDRVEQMVEQERQRLGFRSLSVDAAKVDWGRLQLDALYRKPPFEVGDGKTEKGFRDALLTEAFVQLVIDSPRSVDVCRVVLITGDKLLTRAVESRISMCPNARVLSSIEALKGLINTLISDVDEQFVDRLQAKATKVFFVSAEAKDTIYYRENIHRRVVEMFEAELGRIPEDSAPDETTYRSNGQWSIGETQFVRKIGDRMFWATRLDIEAKATKIAIDNSETQSLNKLTRKWSSGPSYRRAVTHRGVDSYEMVWSTAVTISEELTEPRIEEVKHIGINWVAFAT